MSDWRRDVLTYWFGLKPEQWWKSDPEIDDEIREGFKQRWAQERRLPVDSFLGDPLTALAAVILFDQLPRNMFRGDAEQFATDHLALAIAKARWLAGSTTSWRRRNARSSTCRFSTAKT